MELRYLDVSIEDFFIPPGPAFGPADFSETYGMDDLERELKAGFIEEAQQLLMDAEQCFLQIESSPEDKEIIDQLFRLAHNLKGSAKAVGFMELGAFTHLLESLLLSIKNGKIKAHSAVVDLLLACKDQLQLMVDGLRVDVNASFDCSELSVRLQDAIDGKLSSSVPSADSFPEDAPAAAPAADIHAETQVQIFAGAEPESSMVDSHLGESQIESQNESQNETPATVALAPVKTAPVEKKPAAATAVDESIRVSLSRVDQLINYVGEMVVLQTVLFEQAYAGDLHKIRKTVHQLGKISKEIQDTSMSLRMVPLKQTFQKMTRIVRDTSQVLHKKVTLATQGEDTEVEKTILELIGDPLVHLVRNAVDHGIDSAEERLAAGKPEMGNVTLRAFHQSDNIVLEVQDDGKGINANRLKEKATEKGILKPGQELTEKQALHLIFHPGFSTKTEVSDISGRGVGLDVVKTNIEKLQGSVDVSTELGKGTKFRIQLPLTLAIIDATTVRLNDQRYAIPMSHIHESVQLKDTDIHQSVNLGEFVDLRGEKMRVYRLHQLLGVNDANAGASKIMLVCRAGEQPFGILVHDISSMQQIVVKKLGAELANIVGVSGSAILGDGKPALILDLPRLILRPISKTQNVRMAV